MRRAVLGYMQQLACRSAIVFLATSIGSTLLQPACRLATVNGTLPIAGTARSIAAAHRPVGQCLPPVEKQEVSTTGSGWTADYGPELTTCRAATGGHLLLAAHLQVCHSVHPRAPQGACDLAPTARQPSCRHASKQRVQRCLGAYDQHPIGLGSLGGQLGHHLVRGHSNADCQVELMLHCRQAWAGADVLMLTWSCAALLAGRRRV